MTLALRFESTFCNILQQLFLYRILFGKIKTELLVISCLVNVILHQKLYRKYVYFENRFLLEHKYDYSYFLHIRNTQFLYQMYKILTYFPTFIHSFDDNNFIRMLPCNILKETVGKMFVSLIDKIKFFFVICACSKYEFGNVQD